MVMRVTNVMCPVVYISFSNSDERMDHNWGSSIVSVSYRIFYCATEYTLVRSLKNWEGKNDIMPIQVSLALIKE